MSKALEKYLKPLQLPSLELSQNYNQCLVIPAYGEVEDLLQTLESLPSKNETLIILVVNAREDSPAWVHENNHRLCHPGLDPGSSGYQRDSSCSLSRTTIRDWNDKSGLTILLIDKFSPENYLPPKQGVGLARKIGCDIALKLWSEGKIKFPYIYCSDADVIFPIDYFERIPVKSSAAAYLFQFEHFATNAKNKEAVFLYEIAMLYTVLGLRYAQSQFAYPSLGSILAIHAEAYAKVQGFPKKIAAEDFHMLNKLRKVGEIKLLPGKPLLISGRISERTPFGTGQAVKKYQNETLFFYHPQIFEELKTELESKKMDALEILHFLHQQQKIWPDLSYKTAFSSAKFLEHLHWEESNLENIRKNFSREFFGLEE